MLQRHDYRVIVLHGAGLPADVATRAAGATPGHRPHPRHAQRRLQGLPGRRGQRSGTQALLFEGLVQNYCNYLILYKKLQ